MTQEPEIIFDVRGAAGWITLNRPQVLNALTVNMFRQMDRQLIRWAEDPAIRCVVITGAGDRAFCAGGDIKAVALDALALKKGESQGELIRDIFREEYILNHRIHTFPKPYISLVDGIVMGGGMGLSAHGSYCIVTEKTVFAMPEAGIGFFPDVGGGYFLPRCPGQTGTYLALTSKRIKTFDTIYIGFGTHFVPSAKIAELGVEIARDPGNLEALLKKFSEPPPGESEISPYRDKIDRYFARQHVEEILDDLEKDASPWAAETLKAMQGLSPTSLKIALKQMHLGATMPFADVMIMEYRISQACARRPDFYEGVRAALIDKDRHPRWQPATVAEVPDAEVEHCFESLGAQDLVLPDKVIYTQQRIK